MQVNHGSTQDSTLFSRARFLRVRDQLEVQLRRIDAEDGISEAAKSKSREVCSRVTQIGRRRQTGSTAALAAACILLGSELAGEPRDVVEAAEISGEARRTVNANYILLARLIDMKLSAELPSEHLESVASALGVPQSVKKEAARILKEVEQNPDSILGYSPTRICIAAMYLAGVKINLRISKNKIRIKTGVLHRGQERDIALLQDALERPRRDVTQIPPRNI